MTVKEIQNAIRRAVVRISENVGAISDGNRRTNKNDRKLIERKTEVLQHKYGKGRGTTLKLGFRGRRKAELETQLSEFEAFADYLDSAESRTFERKEKQTRDAYKQFKANYGFKNLKYNDYKAIVTIFGAVGSKIVDQFGSDNLVELFTYADDEQKQDFLNTMLDVMQDAKGQGLTSEELFDEMLFRLQNEQELKLKTARRSRRKRK